MLYIKTKFVFNTHKGASKAHDHMSLRFEIYVKSSYRTDMTMTHRHDLIMNGRVSLKTHILTFNLY